MDLSIKLLQLLGSPFAPTKTSTRALSRLSQIELTELYHCSQINKLLFPYLETISKAVDDFSMVYNQENLRRLKTEDAISRALSVLTRSNIEHAVFKTIRPYKSTTIDIDILIFGDRNYTKAIKAMQEAGYGFVACGPRSTTLWDMQGNIGIDLYEQVAVSFITYMDKGKLIDYVSATDLSNGEYVATLRPEADLACIVAHSVIKEQMYTLSEYFTFVHCLKFMSIKDFVEIVEQNSIGLAVRTHASITALFHKVAHGYVPNELEKILSYLGVETFETSLLIKNNFKTPHRYHLLTVARSLIAITKTKEFKNGVAKQILHMLDPDFSKEVFRALAKHATRETY